jgi:hypothetical protein
MSASENVEDDLARERLALERRLNRTPIEAAAADAGRGVGLAARAVGPMAAGAAMGAAMGAPLAGVGAIPGAIAGATAAGLAQPFADLAVSAWNAATGGRRPLPSQATEQLMTRAGLPMPETGPERVLSTGLRAGTEAMTGTAAARQIASALPATSQFGRPLAQTLATAPGLQTAGATIGATTTQGLLEVGAPVEAAVPAGLVAGVVPGVRPRDILPNQTTPVRQANIEVLRNAGIPLTPGQELNNQWAQYAESAMTFLPTSAARAGRAIDDQMRAWTRAVNRQFGLDSDIATPEVLNAAGAAFGRRFDALEAATVVRPDQRFANDLSQMRGQYVRGLDDSNYRAFESQLARVEQFAAARAQGAEMPGANYRMIDDELRRAVDVSGRSEVPQVREYGKAMERLRESLQGLMERSASATPSGGTPGVPALPGPRNQNQSGSQLRQAWQDLDREYALFSRVREAMGSATGRDKLNTGFIPPTALAQAERASLTPEAFATSNDPFTRLVRAGQLLPNPVPNSGTAQRTMVQDVLTGARLNPRNAAGGAAAQTGVATLAPVTALALPYAVSRAWYADPLSRASQGLLGVRSLYGAMQG